MHVHKARCRQTLSEAKTVTCALKHNPVYQCRMAGAECNWRKRLTSFIIIIVVIVVVIIVVTIVASSCHCLRPPASTKDLTEIVILHFWRSIVQDACSLFLSQGSVQLSSHCCTQLKATAIEQSK